MNRRIFVSGLSATGFGGLLWANQTSSEQVAELEEDVQALDQRVAALETQVAGQAVGDPSPETADQQTPAEPGGVTVEGLSVSVFYPITLAAGRYKVSATAPSLDGTYAFLIMYIFEPSGNSTHLFNVMSDCGPLEGSSFYNAPVDGEYFLQAENTDGAWSATFELF